MHCHSRPLHSPLWVLKCIVAVAKSLVAQASKEIALPVDFCKSIALQYLFLVHDLHSKPFHLGVFFQNDGIYTTESALAYNTLSSIEGVRH